jgi:spore coat protein U-like protein
MFIKLIINSFKWGVALSLLLSTFTFGCVVDFDLTNTTWTMGAGSYNSFDSTEYTQTIQFDVNVLTNGECNFFIGMSDGGESGYVRLAEPSASTQNISYNLYKDVDLTNVLKGTADFVSTSDMLEGTVTSGNSGAYSQIVYLNVPYHQIIESESYLDTIEVKLYEGDWDDVENATLIQTKDVVLTIPVSSSISLSLEDTDYETELNVEKNLETIVNDKSIGINIYVRSNDSYKLMIQSANAETMITGLSNETPLPYEFRVDGTLVDLSSGLAVEALNTNAATVQLGKLYTGQLKVPEIDDVFSGTYEDTITFTVESL